MSIFINMLSFRDQNLVDAARLGVLLGSIAAAKCPNQNSGRVDCRLAVFQDGGVDAATKFLCGAGLYLLFKKRANAQALVFAEVVHKAHDSHHATDVHPMNGHFSWTDPFSRHLQFSV